MLDRPGFRHLAPFLALFACLGTARAEEGRIPIFEPVVLDASMGPISGKYVVTREIQPPDFNPPEHVIQIIGTGSEIIDIDLNGFTLRGQIGTGLSTISASNVRKLSITNGTATSEPGVSGCIVATAGTGTTQVIIEDVLFECGNFGMQLSSWKDVRVRHNTVQTESGAIEVSGATVFQGVIEHNYLRAGGSMGSPGAIEVDAPSVGLVIRSNEIIGGGGPGIAVSAGPGVLVEDNAVNGGGPAYFVSDSDGCRVRNNSAVGSFGTGFSLVGSDDCLVADNVARGNEGIGLDLINADRNHIERNVLNNQGGGPFNAWGLHFDSNSSDNSYGRNTATGNVGPAVQCPASPDPACGAPNLCDEGSGNKSFGDNLVPGPPPC